MPKDDHSKQNISYNTHIYLADKPWGGNVAWLFAIDIKMEMAAICGGEFLEIHRGKREPDPCGNRGQPSVWRITHCLSLQGCAQSSANAGSGFLCPRPMPDISRWLEAVLPDMTGNSFRILPVLRAAFPHRATLTDVAFTLVFPISFTVGGSTAQDLVLQMRDTVVLFIVYIRIPGQVSFFGSHRNAPSIPSAANLCRNVQLIVAKCSRSSDMLYFSETSDAPH